MAGGKKKKKPTANPARGFATTSIASKPRSELFEAQIEPVVEVSTLQLQQGDLSAHNNSDSKCPGREEQTLTPEEFEKNLEESELQLLVEKHAQKVKRDATRQKSRLETDRRVLRSQSEVLSSRKWLPAELMEQILDLIKLEGKFSGTPMETSQISKDINEEDLTVKLWVLQKSLVESGFPEKQVLSGLQYIVDITTKINATSKDAIWGMEECLDWLASNCSKQELPGYDGSQRKSLPRSHTENPADSSSASDSTTPRLLSHHQRPISPERSNTLNSDKKASTLKKSLRVDSDSEVDPDDLLSVHLECMTQLFHSQIQSKGGRPNAKPGIKLGNSAFLVDTKHPKTAKLLRKIEHIEGDVLFDRYVAYQQWEASRIALEKQASEARRLALEQTNLAQHGLQGPKALNGSDDDISRQAETVGAALLEGEHSDSDGALVNLFASLPITEVDPLTGKSSTVVTENNGITTKVRDFGRWTGVNPARILEETCRARDSSVSLKYSLISESPHSNRHALNISWSKPQDLLASSPIPDIEHTSSPKLHTFAMLSVSNPDAKQSEAYIATVALFLVFGFSSREDKASLRLPPVWKELWMELVELRKGEADEIDRNTIRTFRNIVREKKNQELEEGVLITGAFRNRGAVKTTEISDELKRDMSAKVSISDEEHQRIWFEKSRSPSYQAMLDSRMKLPMYAFKAEVLRAMDTEQCIIVCGETGCGKSTQVPSFILEHVLSQGKHCKIYCTEPRRISAISLARRVSEELGEWRTDLGTSRSLVGYAIRLETNISKETRLVYATTGIVLRMLEGSNELRDITHIILDEVHERTIDSDFLLIVLRKLMTRRSDLKVILMSATVDGERFSKYLDGARILNVPGRTFPVNVRYLEDAVELTGYTLINGTQERFTDLDDDIESEPALSNACIPEKTKSLSSYSAKTRNTIAQLDEYRIDFDLVSQLVCKIASDAQFEKYSKAILIFLPGIAEIRQLNDLLVGHPTFSSNWFVYPLHSTIASEDQEAAFLVPPPGTRKIILATNIAETGITIPDVTCVIDAGKHREMRFDERRQLSRLLETFISRANAKQRRGRAGRVQEGLCFHLFTRYRHDELMADQQTPEFLRLSLQDLAIRVKICKLGGIEEVLSEALDPPSSKNIRRAIDALVDVRALTASECLTPLGAQLAKLPLDVFLGKLLLLGSIFKCLDAVVTIAAILSSKSPFSAPFGARAQADSVRLAFRRGDSDLLTVYNAYLAWKRVCVTGGSEYMFCRKNFLSPQTLSNIEDLKGQLVVSLVDSGFLPLTDREKGCLNKARFSSKCRQFFDIPLRANLNSDNDLITSSVICWSFYPKLLLRDGKGYRSLANNQSISIHPTSVNKGHTDLKYLSFYHIMQAKQFYNAHETTVAEEFAVALLCGDVRCDMYAGVFVIDGNRARFAVSDWKTMLVIKTLRMRLREILTKSFKNPGKPLTKQQQKWMDVWQKIFSKADNDRKEQRNDLRTIR